MREEIAFMCLSERCELERLDNGNIKLTLKDRKGISCDDIIKVNDTSIVVFCIDSIEYDQDDGKYYFHFIIEESEGNKESILFGGEGKYLKVEEYEKGFIITFKDINKFDSYPQYRTEIKDDNIKTYFIPTIYSDEYVLIDSKYTLEAINIHEQIKEYMKGIINVFFDDMSYENRKFLYFNDMVYEINSFKPNIAEITKLDMYDLQIDGDSQFVTYNELYHKNAIIFDSKTMFIYHGLIIKNGDVIGNLNNPQSRDLEDILYPLTSDNYNSSKILDMYNSIKHLDETIQLINDMGAYELLDQLPECIGKISTLNEEIRNRDVMIYNECEKIIYIQFGELICYNYSTVVEYIEAFNKTLGSLNTCECEE